jgi:hypothetical protein
MMLAMVHDDWFGSVFPDAIVQHMCQTHRHQQANTPIPDSTDARAETTDAAGLQRAGPVVPWKKTCSDKVHTNMYRFGICALNYHRAEYTKLESLQTPLGNLAVNQAKAK